MKWLLPLTLALGMSACSDREEPAQSAESPTAANDSASEIANARPVPSDEWLGRWIGVEGLNLTVSKGAEPGRYLLQMQYGTDSDMSGSFEGVGTAEGIAFTRPDGAQLLRAATGDETGLKYLAGKSDCLKVKDGEGYCRQ